MKLDQGSRAFFEVLAEAVEPFRSHHTLPDANVNGCRVVAGAGKDRGKIRFGFMGKNNTIITLDIVSRDILADPKEYIGNMLEALNDGMNQMASSKIISPRAKNVH